MRILPNGAVLGTTGESRTICAMVTEHLTGPAGVLHHRRLCERLIHATLNDRHDFQSVQKEIRTQASPELAAFVTTIANLQTKAVRKLQEPETDSRIWWVTSKSLQQATAWQVARLKSQWFANHPVFDLCCGIGGDALQLMARGPLVVVDSDPLIAELVAANLEIHRVLKSDAAGAPASPVEMDSQTVTHEPTRVICGDVTRLSPMRGNWIHIDPDRRPQFNLKSGRASRVSATRKSNPEHYLPEWKSVVDLISNSDGSCVKLAPAANPEIQSLSPTHRCWISLSGSVREQTLLSGGVLANSGLPESARSAAVVKSDGTTHWFAPELESIVQHAPSTSQPLHWLVDPDPAIRAAGLTETYAAQNRFAVLGHASGFLTSADAPTPDGVSIFAEVLWSGSCDDRKLRRELRQRNFYPAVVKVRGTDHQPENLMRKYRKCGEQPICLWIGRGKERVFAAFTQKPDHG